MLNYLNMSQLFAFLTYLALTTGHDERLIDEDGHYHHRGCATEEYNEALLAQDAEWSASLSAFEDKWRARQSSILSGEYLDSINLQSITIPVVFHIVSLDPFSVPDSAIAFQLQVLQDDFSANNNDYDSGVPEEFHAVRSGDTLIRFYTQEVLRVATTVPSFGTNNGIKFSSQGGSDVVDPDRNLNFWAGTLSGGLLGYAQFPGGNPLTDGVVQGLGTLSPEIGNPPYNLGRTGTHEIGHWLNLRHIWGDNSGCTNTQIISDFVVDTPPSSSANFGCPLGVKRCAANPYSQDMAMNFMDYVEDSCMVMWTQLQNARAQASIEEYRGGFMNSKVSNQWFVNWLYFTKFEGTPDDDAKCIGDDQVFYEGDINGGSDSGISIYGCLTKTNQMSVDHITDIYISDQMECDDGYIRSSQDLNEGNGGDIYVCYKKERFVDGSESEAVLDVTFVNEQDGAILEATEQWTVSAMNVNPNGSRLSLAVRRGTITAENGEDSDLLLKSGKSSNNGDSGNETQDIYIGIGLVIAGVVVVVLALTIWKCICSQKGMKEYIIGSMSEEYGTTLELSSVSM